MNMQSCLFVNSKIIRCIMIDYNNNNNTKYKMMDSMQMGEKKA